MSVFQTLPKTVLGKQGTRWTAHGSRWSIGRVESMFNAQAPDTRRVGIRQRHVPPARRACAWLVRGEDAVRDRA